MEPKRMIISHSEPDYVASPVTCPPLPLTSRQDQPWGHRRPPGAAALAALAGKVSIKNFA